MSLMTPVTADAFVDLCADMRTIASAWQMAARRATEKRTR